MRWVPGQAEWHGFAGINREVGDRGEVLAVHIDARAQLNRIGTGDGAQAIGPAAYPRHDMSIIEPEDGLHPHRYMPAPAFDQPEQVDTAAMLYNRHEIDYRDTVAARHFELGLQHQRIATVTAAADRPFVVWSYQPAAVFLSAQQRRKTGG